MKKGILLLSIYACALGMAYTEPQGARQTLSVGVIVGPSGIGMARLMANPPVIPNTTIEFEKAGSIDVLLPKIINGDIDIGILPPNVAAKLYNKAPKSISVAAIVGNGMLSIITRDTSIQSIQDLKGKTVYVAGQGSTPEYVFRAILAKNGLRADSVILDYSLPTQEIAPAMASGKIAYALVPEPFATVAIMKGSGASPIKRALILRDLWSQAGFGTDYPMTLCVVRKDYADKNRDAVARFLTAYRESIEWTVSHPVDAGQLVESAGHGIKSDVATIAIPSCGFAWVDAKVAKKMIESLLSVFLEYSPESIGGKLPDDGFYLK